MTEYSDESIGAVCQVKGSAFLLEHASVDLRYLHFAAVGGGAVVVVTRGTEEHRYRAFRISVLDPKNVRFAGRPK